MDRSNIITRLTFAQDATLRMYIVAERDPASQKITGLCMYKQRNEDTPVRMIPELMTKAFKASIRPTPESNKYVLNIRPVESKSMVIVCKKDGTLACMFPFEREKVLAAIERIHIFNCSPKPPNMEYQVICTHRGATMKSEGRADPSFVTDIITVCGF